MPTAKPKPEPAKIFPPAKFARTIKAAPGFTIHVDTTHPPTELYWAKISDLKLDPNNAKTHPERSIEALTASFSRFGQQGAVVVQRKTRIVGAGNGTTMALANKLGWEFVQVRLTDLEGPEFTAFCLAHNKTAEHNEWDLSVVGAQLKEIEAAGLSVGDLGWATDELKALMGGMNGDGMGGGEPSDAEPQIDQAAELNKEWKVKAGDLFSVGAHRLLCGNSCKAQDVARLLGGAAPNLMVTDPPYGVEYDADWRNEAAEKGLISHAARRVGRVENDSRVDWSEAWELFPGNVAYCWHADRHASEVQRSLESVGFEMRTQIIWAKTNFAISRGHYHWQHEPCWYAFRKGETAGWLGDHSQTTLWQITWDKNIEGGHSTQKPLECMARPIRNHEGDVYDPFLGSGTTMVAAENLNRKCYALEVSPEYCAVILQRMADAFPGIKIERIAPSPTSKPKAKAHAFNENSASMKDR